MSDKLVKQDDHLKPNRRENADKNIDLLIKNDPILIMISS